MSSESTAAAGYQPPIAAVDGTAVEEIPMDELIDETSTLQLANSGYPPMGLTENNSATYLSSGNPCLDFFFHVVPNTLPENLIERLQSSWVHDPLTTLKLIGNLRGVRGTGKSDKESFYTAALWLHQHHPKTLALNLAIFAEFGYYKDLPEIIYRLLEGAEVRENARKEHQLSKCLKGKAKSIRKCLKGKAKRRMKYEDEKTREVENKARLRARVSREDRVEANKAELKEAKARARSLRKEREAAMVKKAREKYNNDPNFKFLHDQVSTLFAYLLKFDIQLLNSGDCKISLAGKWCPTIDSSYDKATLICESIARKIFPRESCPDFEGIEEDLYVMRARNRLRKEILVPLHEALKLPEVYMSAREWRLLPYERVASVAMRNYTEIFWKHDNERFREYLERVKVGDAKIAAGALLPHDIISSLYRGSGATIVAELQWIRMADDLLKKGKLTNCIAVCDVSGSMYGTPMEVSVALGLLVSELSEEPWKGRVITFSSEPELHLIEGDNLKSKTKFIRYMNAGWNTDFQKVFDRILEVAVDGKLSDEQMVKRVFVFSDMEFDEASSNPWETDFQVVKRKFKEKGYEKVPEIVFWNLRDSSATPVTAKETGVALLSGFSKNLLTLFLEEGGAINPKDLQDTTSRDTDTKPSINESLNPEATMEAAISGELYQKFVIYD